MKTIIFNLIVLALSLAILFLAVALCGLVADTCMAHPILILLIAIPVVAMAVKEVS